MLAALVYKLEAVDGGTMPASHGRFAHAAALQLIGRDQQDLAQEQHNNGTGNEFTASLLDFGKLVPVNNAYTVQQGDICLWRLTAMRADLAQALLQVPVGLEIRIGSMSFTIRWIICNPQEMKGTGAITKDDFVASIYSLPSMQTLELSFVTPTVFRVNDRDYPFPLPELIFTSLAKRVEQCLGMTLPVDAIREQAQGLLLPIKWHGETKRLFLGRRGGVTGFTGSITYDLRYLDPEMQKLLLLLAEAGCFTGLGRLTGQGLGQLRVRYR